MTDLAYKQTTDEEFASIRLEKDLTGNDIKELLRKSGIDEHYYINSERSEGGSHHNPFDMVLGDKKNYKMQGLEIKGDTDNFGRLKTQLDAYTRCFDEVYLVLHKKEAPEWLFECIGIIRVTENSAWIEKHSFMRDYMEITTEWDWDAVLKANKISTPVDNIKRAYEAAGDIRKNVLFNRLFGTHEWGNNNYSQFFPLSDYQKSIIIGFNIQQSVKTLNNKIRDCEKNLELIKTAIKLYNQPTKIKRNKG